jgi:hypothetical protein
MERSMKVPLTPDWELTTGRESRNWPKDCEPVLMNTKTGDLYGPSDPVFVRGWGEMVAREAVVRMSRQGHTFTKGQRALIDAFTYWRC